MRGRTNAVSGTVLPELSNPAGAANIQSGYQAINGAGEVVTGTAAVRETVVVTVINNSNDTVRISYCERFLVAPNTYLPARTTGTYNAVTESLFVVSPLVESSSIQVENSQQYNNFLSYDNVYGALVNKTAFTLTLT